MNPERHIQIGRLSTSEEFLRRVREKDGIIKPVRVPFEKIAFNPDPNLSKMLGFNRELRYAVALPLYVDESELNVVNEYKIRLRLENRRREIAEEVEPRPGTPDVIPHMVVSISRVFKIDGELEEVPIPEQIFEIFSYRKAKKKYPSRIWRKIRPNATIYRRKAYSEGRIAYVRSAIELGYKNGDKRTHCMALVLGRKGSFNTRFVFTHDNEITYSKEQMNLDEGVDQSESD